MKGLELARKYYLEVGREMLCSNFPELFPRLAIGLIGSGSECYGYDDELSCDHDFEPGFCIFIPDDLDSKTVFALERAYSALPQEFCGYKRSRVGAVGGNRHGVIKTSRFFEDKTGTPDGVMSLVDWLTVPEYALFEATNGEVFEDNLGELSKIRERLSYYPEDVRLKKLAGNLLIMAQSGQYNFNRLLTRGETAAAQLAVFEFVKSAMSVIFLLNKKYMPYYKWSFRALREMPVLGDTAKLFEYLLTSKNSENEGYKKGILIERLCADIAREVRRENLVPKYDNELERVSYTVNDKIKDPDLRNSHILTAI